MKSIKTKMIVLVLSCLLVTSCAIGGASIINSRRVVSSDSAQIMSLLCESRSQKIDALLGSIEQSVDTLTVYAVSQVGDLQRFQTDSAYLDDYSNRLSEIAINAAKNTEGALTVYIRFDPEFAYPTSGIFCSKKKLDRTFQKLTPTDLSQYDPSDTSHVGWFYEPAEAKTGIWMAPYHNDNIDVEMISYVVPFYVDDVFLGVVGMDIDFEVLQNVVTKTQVYENGYAFLTDNDSNIVYHKDIAPGSSLTEYNGGEFRDMAMNLRQPGSGEELYGYTYKGESRQLSFRSLQNDMRFVLTAPTREINQQADFLIWQIALATAAFLILASIWTLIFTRRMVRPLLELNVAAQKIADGDTSVVITHESKDEVGMLAESFRKTVKHLHRYISYINELAYRDPLTGVKNKTAYLEMVSQLEEALRLKRPEFAVVVFDLNWLKEVNDNHGHDFGDMLISDASKVICQVFKRSPVYRIGGDEFVAILENSDFREYASLLERFQEAVDIYNRQPRNDIMISVARGIAVFEEETDLTYNDVFKRADDGMYRNKAQMKAKQGNRS